MPTVVDSLIIELGLDPTKFGNEEKRIAGRLAGFKRMTTSGAKDAEDNLKRISDAFDSMAKKIVGYVAGFITARAALNFSKGVVEANRNLGNMADAMAINIQKLSALGNAFDRMGGSSESVLGAIKAWDDELKGIEMTVGDPMQSRLVKFLNQLGQRGINVNPFDATGKQFRDITDIFLEVSDKLAKSPLDARTKALLLSPQVSGLPPDVAAVMLRGKGAMMQEIEDQKKILAVTEEQRKVTDKLNSKWVELEQTAKRLGQEVLVDLAGGLQKVLDVTIKFIRWLSNEFNDPKSIIFMPTIAKARRLLGLDQLGKPYLGGKEGATGQGWPRTVEGGKGSESGQTGGPSPEGSTGGSAGITAPAGTPIHRSGMATVTTSTGRKFQVDARYAQNFQGFIDDYEKAGGVIGPESGTLGHRPHNRSGHPIGAAIDINQVGYGIRGRGGKTLPTDVEDALAEKWGLTSGNKWRRPDTGHFGIRSPEAASQALIANGVNQKGQQQASKDAAGGWPAPLTAVPFMNFKPIIMRAPNVSNTTRTDINNVTVNSQAQDATAIAGDIAAELRKQMTESEAAIP